MIAFARNVASSNVSASVGTVSPPTSYDGFLKLLPAIRADVRFAFRQLMADAHEEATQEAVANAFVAYARLADQGRSHIAAATPLARFAVAQVRAGRMVGTRFNVRDVSSVSCCQRKGVQLERLDRWDERKECWQEALVEDRNCTPAELAASRIDFEDWLQTLPSRKRQIALKLAEGERTRDVARVFGLSPARISQLRSELHTAWEEFHQGLPTESEFPIA
ncbi:MAG: hypothetical protein IT428_27465 [Planctomycetaceae bacterium]|nr:hypothetical protein [Planctomycetaceae bacterium]